MAWQVARGLIPQSVGYVIRHLRAQAVNSYFLDLIGECWYSLGSGSVRFVELRA